MKQNIPCDEKMAEDIREYGRTNGMEGEPFAFIGRTMLRRLLDMEKRKVEK